MILRHSNFIGKIVVYSHFKPFGQIATRKGLISTDGTPSSQKNVDMVEDWIVFQFSLHS